MKKLLLLVLLITATPSFGRTFGLGVILGDPTGFTGKLWVDRNDRAVDFGLAYSFGDYLLLYADYLFHFPNAFRGTKEKFLHQLSPYVGVGAAFWILTTSTYDPNRRYFATSRSSFGMGMRIPLGIEWLPPTVPLGVFLEIAPGVGFVPRTFAFIQAGIGVRFYF